MKGKEKKEPNIFGLIPASPVSKSKSEKQILNSKTKELELLKIKVGKIEEAVNLLLEQTGLRPIEEDQVVGPKPIRYGE